MIKIAALKDSIVINIYFYATKKEATHFYSEGAFGDADDFVEISKDLEIGIGDKYDNGEWIEKEIDVPEPDEAQDIQAALVSLQQMSLMRSLGVEIPVEQQAEMEVKALGNIDIPASSGEFKTGVKADKDAEVTYKDVTYKCISPHITQSNWTPDKTPALWVEVKAEYAEFKQPTGAHDAYSKGDKITFEGKRYESLIDGNAYSPAAYPTGWKLIK